MDPATVAIYEREAERWRAARVPHDLVEAEGLRSDVGGGVIADLGCGPGWYGSALGAPLVSVDAAASMLAMVRDTAPHAHALRADLEHLPLRRGGLGGAWARASYVHIHQAAVPRSLADLHNALRVGGRVQMLVFGGDRAFGDFGRDDFPGRNFSLWPPERFRDVLLGAGFAIERFDIRAREGNADDIRVSATRARTLPDTVGPDMRLLVCGLNPSIHAADAGVGFARPGNRFWRAALAAGLVARDRDPVHALDIHRIGMTDIVKRATRAASELDDAEYAAGVDRLERLVAWLRPAAVCFVGLAGWRAAVDTGAGAGPQDRALGGRPVYVVPSTSGLNAHTQHDDFVRHFAAAAALADRAA